MTDLVSLLKQAQEHAAQAQVCLDQVKEPLGQAEKLAPILRNLRQSVRKQRWRFFNTILDLQMAVVADLERAIKVTGFTISCTTGMYQLHCYEDGEDRGFKPCRRDEFYDRYQAVFWEYCEKVVAQVESVLQASPYLREAEKLNELITQLTKET